jgi:hypothetical protein
MSLRQCGVFTAAQAEEAGWTSRQIRRRLESGRWAVVAGRGLSASRSARTAGARGGAWAGRLTWPESIACGATAAAVLGWPVPENSAIEVYAHRSRRPWGRLRPITTARPPPAVMLGGLAVTGPERTAAECFCTFTVDDALNLYAWLTSRSRIDRTALEGMASDLCGRRGVVRLQRLLDLTADGAVSVAEVRLHEVLHMAGIRLAGRCAYRGRRLRRCCR